MTTITCALSSASQQRPSYNTWRAVATRRQGMTAAMKTAPPTLARTRQKQGSTIFLKFFLNYFLKIFFIFLFLFIFFLRYSSDAMSTATDEGVAGMGGASGGGGNYHLGLPQASSRHSGRSSSFNSETSNTSSSGQNGVLR